MPATEPALQRLCMSWEEFLDLPDEPKAEWVDGEVVLSPMGVSFDHGDAVMRLGVVLMSHCPGLRIVTETGVFLPGNRLRAPDLTAVVERPEGRWISTPPVLVAEVLSPSTRSEDVRKSAEYAAGGVGQFWVVDPDHGSIDVYRDTGLGWELLLHLDAGSSVGEVLVGDDGEHGTVRLRLDDVFRA